MSAGLPSRFDPQRLAAQDGGAGGSLKGELDTSGMLRLTDLMAVKDAVPVSFELKVFRDEARRLIIEGSVSAELACECQRCVEPAVLPVKAEFSLALIKDEDAARNLPAELDPLLVERDHDIDLAALLEDELILALPQIPVHENVADCGERIQHGREADEEFDGGAQRQNPFAVLEKLKNRNN